jgi:hypothetical protein
LKKRILFLRKIKEQEAEGTCRPRSFRFCLCQYKGDHINKGRMGTTYSRYMKNALIIGIENMTGSNDLRVTRTELLCI